MKIMYFNCNAKSNYNGSYVIPSFITNRILGLKPKNRISETKPDIVILTEAIPCFEPKSYNQLIEDYMMTYSKYIKGKKNSVIILVKKDTAMLQTNYELKGFDNDEPNYLNVIVKKNEKKYNIIGFRMMTGENDYNGERKIFDKFINNNKDVLLRNEMTTILAGDFNNGNHYGSLKKSFQEVEPEYWRQDYDEEKRMYFGPKYKRDQYNYNLHIIKDTFAQNGLVLVEGEDDYSFIKHYSNNDITIHDDHLFVSQGSENGIKINFFDGDETLDHRYFEATVD